MFVRTLIAFLLIISPAQAADLALLVGVSGYPSLPAELRLQGPANDVRLLRQALLKKGVLPERINVLADGVEEANGLPTLASIRAALQKLAGQAGSGDWVMLYFSGHGSQQPRLQSDGNEPDRLDEIFLPYDVGRWHGKIGRVEGALIDDEIGVAIRAIRRRGAQVWVVFDTCHAGDMIKAYPPGRDAQVRGLPSQALGIPDKSLPLGHAGLSRRTPDGVVAFYASQADEPALEERFAMGLQPARRQGVFTWHLAHELARSSQNFQSLAQRIQLRYRQEKRPFPTPQFVGALGESPTFIR